MMSAVLLSDYNWGFNSVPQAAACLDLVNKSCQYPRGQGFGGTSLINGLMYVRGNREDFDRWEREGNPGWSYDEVLPYFLKSEDLRHTDLGVEVDWDYHGEGGEFSVETTAPRHPLVDYWLDANAEKGYDILDYNGRRQTGASVIQMNTNGGKRADFGSAFIKPIRNRENLTILPRAYVAGVILEDKKATGVKFTSKGKTYIASTTKEVVLSAGVFGSAQILMLSGIGPPEHLTEVGIDTIVDLQVGSNLADHPTYYGLNFEANFTKTHEPLEQYIEEYLSGAGPLTAPHFGGGLGFYQTKPDIPDYRDVELIMFPNDYFSDTIAQKLSAAREKTWTNLNQSCSFMVLVVALHAKSKGTVRLRSSNPFDYPIIDPQLLTDPSNNDVDSLYRGIKIALDLIQTQSYAQIDAMLVKQKVPACDNEEYLSEEYWHCVLHQFTWDLYHPVGTCRMGPRPEDGDVVDVRNRVHGVENLRVADASIFPFTLSGHPNAVCGMIGEKVADLIKSEYGIAVAE